jgi:hypothetical protein
MKIIPYGNSNSYLDYVTQSSIVSVPQSEETSEDVEAEEVSTEPEETDGREKKIKSMENAIAEILGEPNLDNLMIILTAVGMSKLSFSMSEDNSHLSVAGIIDLSEDDGKIKKE